MMWAWKGGLASACRALVLKNPRRGPKAGQQPGVWGRGTKQASAAPSPAQWAPGSSHCNGRHPRPCWHGHGLARSDLEFNPTYRPRHRCALTRKSQISPGACCPQPVASRPPPRSYPESVTRRPAHRLPPGPWAAGTQWRPLRPPLDRPLQPRGSQRGCPSPPRSTGPPPFLSSRWQQNLGGYGQARP